MDLNTSFAFYFVSLALYVAVLTAMALADKRVVGTRWLAYSVLIELIKVGLQAGAGKLPRLLTTMVANELNMVAFFTMYLGLRWFVQREPLRSRTGPMVLILLMVGYCGMFLLKIPYAFHVTIAVVVWICGATLWTLWRQREERFRVPGAILMSLLAVEGSLLLYRGILATEIYRRGKDWHPPTNDPRWTYSMLGIVMVSNCLLIMYVWFTAAEMYSAVETTAGTDVLTGSLNRRALMKLAVHEVARSSRAGMPLTVVAIDLDNFKSVNDTYGHAAGDAVLIAAVSVLRHRLRSVDVVARTGGDEFVLLLPDTDAVSGSKVVEGLRQAVEAVRLEHDGEVLQMTMSAGVTQNLPSNDTWLAMLNRADHALYAAKRSGRNRVILEELAAKLPRRAIGVRTDGEDEALVGRGERSELRLIRKRQG